MKKLFLRAEFGPLWEPWEEDEIGRKKFTLGWEVEEMVQEVETVGQSAILK